MNSPRVDHMNVIFKVLRYIKQSPGQGLFISATNPLTLTAYCDSDWGGDPITWHSLAGYCVLLESFLVSRKCKKQHNISWSAVEIEYHSMADTWYEVIWLVAILKVAPLSIQFHCDFKSAIYILLLILFIVNVRNILKLIVTYETYWIDFHLVRENIDKGLISLIHIASAIQPAYMFTKTHGSFVLSSLSSSSRLNVFDMF